MLAGKVYKPVGHCIYCGTTADLTKEHILPLALGGSAILPKSSCRHCASITGNFEQSILRGSVWPVRVFRDLKSRSKHSNAPRKVSVSIVRDRVLEDLQLDLEHAPILLPFPVFNAPWHLSGLPPEIGISVIAHVTIRFGEDPVAVCSDLDGSEIIMTAKINPCAFARTIAKIGYAFAYAEGAIAELDGESYVLPALLGQLDEIGRWVGTLTKPLEAFPSILHRVLIHRDLEKGLLLAEVQLFSDSPTPCYGVILGKLKPKAT